MNTYQKLVIWSHQQVIRYIQEKSSFLLEMNCLPSGKLISNRNKNKTLSAASQKYEQRIKSAKNRPGIQLIMTNDKMDNNESDNYNNYMENWLKKRTDIDNWRRDVISAMQHDIADRASSINTYDSLQQPDSSTLTTTSTLLSAGEIYKRNLNSNQKFPVSFDSHNKQIPKSPSIPLFQSKTRENNILPKFSYSINRNKIDEKDSVNTDDDEVFIPINPENCRNNNIRFNEMIISSNRNSSSYYNTEYFPNHFDINHKFTPQPIKKTWNFPVSQNFKPVEKPLEQYQHQQYQFNGNAFQNYCQERVFPVVSNGNFQNDMRNNGQLSNLKKNLHKTETNAKLILRQNSSSSSQNNEQKHQHFQRTGSLNIKNLTINNDPNRITICSNDKNNNFNRIPKRAVSTKNIDVNYPTNSIGYQNNQLYQPTEKKLLSVNMNRFHNTQPQYVILIPTCSQENISLKNQFENQCRPLHQIKNNSLGNLREQIDFIPKVSINKPLTMKFAFSSEPNLAPNQNQSIKLFS